MKEIKYNPNNVPPTWFGLLPGVSITSTFISDDDYSFCEKIALDYKIDLSELCALVQYVKDEGMQGLANTEYSELTKILSEGGKIKYITVTTDKGSVKLNDPSIVSAIHQRYKPWQIHKIEYKSPELKTIHVSWGDGIREPEKNAFRVLLATLISYFEYKGLGISQRRVIIGMICAHVGLYCKHPLMTEQEWNDNNKQTEAITWKAYLNNNVKTWIKEFER